jgi:hypothetical protein
MLVRKHAHSTSFLNRKVGRLSILTPHIKQCAPLLCARRLVATRVMSGCNSTTYRAICIWSVPAILFNAVPARSLSSDNKAEIRDFDPILAKKMIHEEEGVLIDCRTLQEFQSGAPSTAVLIPYDQIPGRLDEVTLSS